MRWTVAEMEMLTRLANEGISHDEIAQVCLSSVVDAPPPRSTTERAWNS